MERGAPRSRGALRDRVSSGGSILSSSPPVPPRPHVLFADLAQSRRAPFYTIQSHPDLSIAALLGQGVARFYIQVPR